MGHRVFLSDCIRTAKSRRILMRIGLGAIALLLLATAGQPVTAQSVPGATLVNREYAIKATYLYHFLTYIEWPQGASSAADAPLVIGVYQEDPFGAALRKIASTKTARNRPIVVQVHDTLDGLRDVNILFVPSSVPPEALQAVLTVTRGSAVLIVGEADDFIEQGGDVQFFQEGNNIRFAFRVDVAKTRSLKVSSKLMSVARSVPSR